MSNYRKRIADAVLAEKLSYMGAVLVRGAKKIRFSLRLCVKNAPV